MFQRAIILQTIVIVLFVIIGIRLFDLMILSHGRFKERALSQHYKNEKKEVTRGLIFDRRGRELAINIDVESVYVRPKEVQFVRTTAKILSTYLEKRPELILANLSSKDKFVWLERKVMTDRTGPLKKLELKGIGFIPETKRYYPRSTFASNVIGAVDIDNRGIEGIELQYDSYLRSPQVRKITLRDANGRLLSEGIETPSKGNNIILTIDETLQFIAENELEKALFMWNAKWGMIVMMDPLTGEILAMAVRPTFDPNNVSFSKDYERRNRAITDTFEPGSIFKIVTAIGALEEGIVTPETKIDCRPGYIIIGGKRIKDIHPNGIMTFRDVLIKSSNVGIIKVAKRLSPEKIYIYARKLGFGSKTGIDLPGEVQGMLKDEKRWSSTSIGAIPIGYEVAVTPLQILRAYAVIANGGRLVKPYIVSQVTTSDGEVLFRIKPEYEQVISKSTANILKGILTGVTSEGTGTLALISGNRVAGKTGTARLYDSKKKRYLERYVSSFVGFVPADNPRIVAIVVIGEPEKAYYGGEVAAPVFRSVLEASLSYLRIPLDSFAVDYKEEGKK